MTEGATNRTEHEGKREGIKRRKRGLSGEVGGGGGAGGKHGDIGRGRGSRSVSRRKAQGETSLQETKDGPDFVPLSAKTGLRRSLDC